MGLCIHRDQLPMRIAGSLLGLAFVAVGLYALLGAGPELGAVERERAFGFGISALIAGLIATPVSWLVRRLDNIWCAPPRKGWFRTPGRRRGKEP